MKKLAYITDILLIVVAAALSAVGLHCFVNPAGFAPSGIDGIAMMLQKLLDINIGYISLQFKIIYSSNKRIVIIRIDM